MPLPRSPPHEVRIVGGAFRRVRLAVADVPGLRPTPDRVRETLFNWLGQDLSGWQVADAFAGTGALGLEAASRGAASVLLVERHPQLARALAAAKTRLGAGAVQVQRGDGVAALMQLAPGSLDLALLDPPFDAPDLAFAALAAAARAVRSGGFVYLEAPRPCPPETLAAHGLAAHRRLKAGAVVAQLLLKT